MVSQAAPGKWTFDQNWAICKHSLESRREESLKPTQEEESAFGENSKTTRPLAEATASKPV